MSSENVKDLSERLKDCRSSKYYYEYSIFQIIRDYAPFRRSSLLFFNFCNFVCYTTFLRFSSLWNELSIICFTYYSF